jgi:alginate O-acetyltransferase complex protein AlgI
MLFNSFIFLIFLIVILPVFYLLPNKKTKNLFLLIASYFFYGYWDWRFCILLAVTTLTVFIIGIKLSKTSDIRKRRNLLIISLIVNLGILGVFKYFNFFITSFSLLSNKFGISLDFLHLNIILPVGISFYTFQALSYVMDIYRRRLEPTKNLVDFALFVSFFPQLVAGPIERASNLLPQLFVKLRPTREQIEQGIVLIVTGLFRKVMIGDTSGRIVDQIFAQPELYMSFELICGLILFSIQIYADFSGYSRIARGTANLLGVELMKNFEQPYLSRNITEFWHRWHISLSTWLKDYLYIPLGGNRKGNVRTYINLMLTMLLGGLWHGASWNFVLWGGLHGTYLSIHKFIIKGKKIAIEYEYKGFLNSVSFIFSVLLTNILVLFAWLFFRAKDSLTIRIFFDRMIHWKSSELSSRFLIITLSFVGISLLIDLFEYFSKPHMSILKIPSKSISAGVLAGLLLVTLLFMFQSDPLPFVYFQF